MYRGRGFLPPAGASFFITVSGAGAFGGAGGDYARHAQERVKRSEQRLSRVWGRARPWQLAEPRTIEAHSRTAVTDRYQRIKLGAPSAIPASGSYRRSARSSAPPPWSDALSGAGGEIVVADVRRRKPVYEPLTESRSARTSPPLHSLANPWGYPILCRTPTLCSSSGIGSWLRTSRLRQ